MTTEQQQKAAALAQRARVCIVQALQDIDRGDLSAASDALRFATYRLAAACQTAQQPAPQPEEPAR